MRRLPNGNIRSIPLTKQSLPIPHHHFEFTLRTIRSFSPKDGKLLKKKKKSSMDAEASSFEPSEMLASFVASTPLLRESWRLCHIANTTAPRSFTTEQAGDVGYIAFSGVQEAGSPEPTGTNLLPLESAGNGLFLPLQRQGEDEEPAMVHAEMLQLYLSLHVSPSFQNQMTELMEKSKSIIMTGHCIGGTTASLCALWLLSYFHTVSSPRQVLCITFGSPLLGNGSLSRAILRERWGGNFCHVVSKHDIMPRLLFAPLASLSQMQVLLQNWQLSMTSPPFDKLLVQLRDDDKAELFRSVLLHLQALAEAGQEATRGSFWPFGSYLFCSKEGAICVDNAVSVVKMMYLMLKTGSSSSSIEDHLKYQDYPGEISELFLNQRSLMQADLPESSYEAGVALALQASGIDSQESVAGAAKDCLKMARRMGLKPNLNSAKLAVRLSKVVPFRAEIEWYKAYCDKSDNQMGYYDCFKRRETSIRESRVNMNRLKLACFWDDVIRMLESNELPHDFLRRAKWVNTSHSYKLLVEPLEIAEYYGSGTHRVKGHYLKHGRERRFEIFDRWWRERRVTEEENNMRSKFAGLTQDSCFWARVEEARDRLDDIRRESDVRKLAFLWENINAFERYARKLVENKEVSEDVLAKNSSYSLWMEEYRVLKSQLL